MTAYRLAPLAFVRYLFRVHLARFVTMTSLALGCSGPSGTIPTVSVERVETKALAHTLPAGLFRVLEPPVGNDVAPGYDITRARILALGDTQLHYLYGKRTFAQSPWADRMLSMEVAVRPAALDDGSDLLLQAFLAERRARYGEHSLVYMGDAADLSCVHEIERFSTILRDTGEPSLLMVTSNHDGFFSGNFTQKADANGGLALTDMPHDWTRACSVPGSRADYRLTKGMAVRRIRDLLPKAPVWATYFSDKGAHAPSDYKKSYLAYARPLQGGDKNAPVAWGLFLDTVDYREFNLSETTGAGTVGGVHNDQLLALEHAMFEVRMQTPNDVSPAWVVFAHFPVDALEPGSKKRVTHFLDVHPNILGYVAAHTHRSDEQKLTLPSGRIIPQYIVGSTTDYPQSGRLIEVKQDTKTGTMALATWRLELDIDTMCAGVKTPPRDSLGYVGYRVSRDDTPDASISFFEKVGVGVGLSQLKSERLAQAAGALLVENDLVRTYARHYLSAPDAPEDQPTAALKKLLESRFPAGNQISDLDPWMRGLVGPGKLSSYDRWIDPVLAPVIPRMTKGVHTFGHNADLFRSLRATRQATPARARYFTCHAAMAARAEAKTRVRRAHIVYVP